MKFRWVATTSMVLMLGCSHNHQVTQAKEAEEGAEVKMSINDVPPAVRDTLMREANGAKITTVDREMMDSKTIYETDVMSGGQNWEIRVDQAGNVISKKAEKE